MPETLIYPNGIDAETGEPLLPSLPVETVAASGQGPAYRQGRAERTAGTRQRVLKARARPTTA